MKFQHMSQPKSTEEREVEEIQEVKKKLAQQRKVQEQFRQKAQAGTSSYFLISCSYGINQLYLNKVCYTLPNSIMLRNLVQRNKLAKWVR